ADRRTAGDRLPEANGAAELPDRIVVRRLDVDPRRQRARPRGRLQRRQRFETHAELGEHGIQRPVADARGDLPRRLRGRACDDSRAGDARVLHLSGGSASLSVKVRARYRISSASAAPIAAAPKVSQATYSPGTPSWTAFAPASSGAANRPPGSRSRRR